jgi:hypothetical protein
MPYGFSQAHVWLEGALIAIFLKNMAGVRAAQTSHKGVFKKGEKGGDLHLWVESILWFGFRTHKKRRGVIRNGHVAHSRQAKIMKWGFPCRSLGHMTTDGGASWVRGVPPVGKEGCEMENGALGGPRAALPCTSEQQPA